MSDISVIWDAANSRGDWSFQPLTVAGQVINVSAPSTFGIGDGVSTLFQLSATQGKINGVVAAQLYRNDWQGSQQLYSTARTNLLLQSQAFTNAAWNQTSNGLLSATGSAGTAPDGTNTATLLTENTANSTHLILATTAVTITAGAAYTVSVFAKAGTRNKIGLYNTTSNNGFHALFDLSAGTVISSGLDGTGTILGASIGSVGNGWFKCSVSGKLDPAATALNPRIEILNAAASNSYTGDGASGLFIWGAQIESGTTPTSYIPTTTAPVTVTDYTINPIGGVMLATPPVSAAMLTWTGSYVSDTVSGGDLATGLDLETAVLVSLFTDRMANRDDPIPDGSGDPRGWWGDIGEDKPIGSRLWLLDRSKQTQEVLNNARDYIFEALQWLVDDGVVASIDVQTQWVRDTFLGAQVTLYQPTGPNVSMAYAWAWNQLS
ncbi:phage head spike fiber domain-containing protein [Burkholderia vietnamiensis]|uniref:phage head spike fiber domain-containing protein n=1 Tax=Burkholderia vietnamiensis TaxID=60552 RepID=UPI001CF32A0E|nr:phage GP46 family protein [Burkholderia vietnamiensis]MCA7985153.1 phage GP46 family protein [Burkholderia vietnamiensis]